MSESEKKTDPKKRNEEGELEEVESNENQANDEQNIPATANATADDELEHQPVTAVQSQPLNPLISTSPKQNPEADVSNTASRISIGSLPEKANLSKLFVMQGLRHSFSVKRPCHLPRKEGVNVKARRKLIIASVLCLFFMVCQVVGGVWSNSLAVAADAGHTLTDFAGFMISLFAIWLAGRKSTDRLSFGWHRAEVIGALASIMTIWCVTAILVWLAIERCITSDFEIDAVIMMIVAAISIVTNIIMGIQLTYGSTSTQVQTNCEEQQQCGSTQHMEHLHSHNHGEGMMMKIRRILKKCCWGAKRKSPTALSENCTDENCNHTGENINVQAAYLHVIGDAIQSVGVLVAGFIIYLRPDWMLADPICTFIFAIIVLYTTIRIIKEILVVLMEGTPTFLDYSEVQATFEGIEGVLSVHNLRIWALSLDKVALAVHLVIDPNMDSKEILKQAESEIHTHYRLFETTIQIEEEGRSTRHSRMTSII